MAYFHQGLAVAFSADGLRFEPYGENPVIVADEGTPYERGYVNVIGDIIDGCWDPLHKRYLIGCKINQGGYPGKPNHHQEGWRRTVGMSVSKDFINWKRPWQIVKPDLDHGIEEFYGFQPMVRGNLYLGFLRVLRDDLSADKGGPVRGIGWTELLTSRDGEGWTRHRDEFLDRSQEPGTWDHAMAWVADCVTVEDKEYVYYGGYLSGHKGGNRQLGMAVLRKNGFVSRDAGVDESVLRTPLVVLDGIGLAVNAAVEGQMRMRISDEQGRPLPNFDWSDNIPINGDSVAHFVEWKGDFSEIVGRPVRLEFAMSKTQLYGFDLIESCAE